MHHNSLISSSLQLKSSAKRGKFRGKRPEITLGSPLLLVSVVSPGLEKNRDAVKAFYGRKWAYESDIYKPILRCAMRLELFDSPLIEAQRLAKAAILEEMPLLAAVFLAVAVEIVEEDAR